MTGKSARHVILMQYFRKKKLQWCLPILFQVCFQSSSELKLYSGLLCVQRPITSLNMTQSAKVLLGGRQHENGRRKPLELYCLLFKSKSSFTQPPKVHHSISSMEMAAGHALLSLSPLLSLSSTTQ